MVARGDLGVELPPWQVPAIQKHIIREANLRGKIVITATQMLESMMTNSLPTRAEAADCANAIYDGTDALMLSGETAIGKYPVQSIRMMNAIIIEAENISPNGEKRIQSVFPGLMTMLSLHQLPQKVWPKTKMSPPFVFSPLAATLRVGSARPSQVFPSMLSHPT